METNDYPNYFIGSDSVSLEAQSRHLCITKVMLVTLVLPSIITLPSTIWELEQEWIQNGCYILAILCRLISIFCVGILAYVNYEAEWYQGRAFAESIKTLTWRYICRSELFEDNAQSKELFIERCKEVSDAFKNIKQQIEPGTLQLPFVTKVMDTHRNSSLSDRQLLYKQERIEVQQKWYADKASYNKKKYKKWTVAICFFQAVAFLSTVALFTSPVISHGIMELTSSIASVLITWTQIKRHNDLAQAYSIATDELNIISQSFDTISSEESFSRFVLDAENAISREHTIWLAQKRVV